MLIVKKAIFSFSLLLFLTGCIVPAPYTVYFNPALMGSVVDQSTGKPISGVQVIAEVPVPRAEIVDVISDERGNYDLQAYTEMNYFKILAPTGGMGFSAVYFIAPGYEVHAESYQFLAGGTHLTGLEGQHTLDVRLTPLPKGHQGPPNCPIESAGVTGSYLLGPSRAPYTFPFVCQRGAY